MTRLGDRRRSRVLAPVLLGLGAVACTPAAPPTAFDGNTSASVAAASARTTGQGTITAPPSWSTYLQIDLGDGTYRSCSGTLISRTVVLTAAHCIERPDGSTVDPSRLTTVIGAGASVESDGTRRAVVAVAVHPSRAFSSEGENLLSSHYDVALLRLAEPVDHSPIPLAPTPDTANPGDIQLLGYGHLAGSASGRPESLRISPPGELRIVPCPDSDAARDHRCMRSIEPTRGSTVPGDSGGPWIRSSGIGVVQVAVTSYSAGSIPGGTIGSDVNDALPWIRDAADLLRVPAGTLVRDPASGAAWRVQADGYRSAVPTASTLECLRQRGADILDVGLLDIEQIPERVGDAEACNDTARSVTEAGAEATSSAATVVPVATVPTVAPPSTTVAPVGELPPAVASAAAAPTEPRVPADASAADGVPSAPPARTMKVWTLRAPEPASAGQLLAITGAATRPLVAGALLLVGAGIVVEGVRYRSRRRSAAQARAPR